ncbi:MAG: class I SAM-dependent methyltransferase [Caldilineaceae bacterium]
MTTTETATERRSRLKERFQRFESPGAVAEFAAGIDERWPYRRQVAQHIVDQLHAQQRTLAAAPLQVLELCAGPGMLAELICTALPTARYVGVDFSPPFLAYARRRLAAYAPRITLLEADLNEDDWSARLADRGVSSFFHAIVSLQSLHDLGGEPELARAYTQARALLTPRGLFLNADLIVAPGEELADNPGRRAIPRHLELLTQAGYTDVQCTLETGGFGCVVGRT